MRPLIGNLLGSLVSCSNNVVLISKATGDWIVVVDRAARINIHAECTVEFIFICFGLVNWGTGRQADYVRIRKEVQLTESVLVWHTLLILEPGTADRRKPLGVPGRKIVRKFADRAAIFGVCDGFS